MKPEGRPGGLKPGLYRLTRDVKNPNPDRRSTHFSKLPMWPKGMRIVAYSRRAELDIPGVVEEADFLFRFNGYEQQGIFMFAGRREPNPVFAALVEAMELEPRSLDSVLRHDPPLRSVLVRLLATKKITLDDIEGAL